MRITISLICVLLTTQLISQSAFSAIMQKTDSELTYLDSAPFEEVQEQNEQYASEGFELVDLEYADSKFWAIWKHTGESTILRQVDSWESFQEIKKEKIKDGRLLDKLLIYKNQEGQQQYIGFWKNKRLAHNVWKLDDLKSVQFHYKEMAKLNLYLHGLEVVAEENSQFSYYLLYQKGSPSDMTHFTQFANEAGFNEDHAKRVKSGYRPIAIEVVTNYGIPNYFCLYRKEKPDAEMQYQLGWESLVHFQNHLGESFKLVDLEFSEGKKRVFAPPYNQDRVKETPDSDIDSLQISTKGSNNNIQNNSAAFAAANGLYWLSQNGFEKLITKTSASPEQTAAKVARKLADGNHMKTLLPSKTSKYTIIEGLSNFIRSDYEVEEIQFFDINGFDKSQLSESIQPLVVIEDSLQEIPIQKAKEGLVGSTIVLVRWGQYEVSADGKHLIKKSDQWGTLVGYGKNEYDIKKTNYLTVHDPSDGEKTRQKFFRIDDLEQYLMITDTTLLKTLSADWKDEAEVFHSLPASKRQVLSTFQEGAENVIVFPVWESLLIIKIKNQ